MQHLVIIDCPINDYSPLLKIPPLQHLEIDEKAYLEFKDNKVITWSAPYIAKAVELGFVSGYEDGTFKPQKDITRAEAFKIFAKVLEYKAMNN